MGIFRAFCIIFPMFFLDNNGGDGYSVFAFCVNKEGKKHNKSEQIHWGYNPRHVPCIMVSGVFWTGKKVLKNNKEI